MLSFFDTFSNPFSPDDRLVIAVSGGIDSMVLLDLFSRNHPKENIVIAHFDHVLRGIESTLDREFIEDYTKKRSIAFEVKITDIQNLAEKEKMSIEAIARKYRYKFFDKIAEKYHAQYILTAHHLDDRIETALFNLIRGSKLAGIHALSKKSTSPRGYTIYRPLLSVTKEEIKSYAAMHAIEYREDSTNLDVEYLRNKLRHHILPEFDTINPDFRNAIANFIDYTENLEYWIDEEVREFLGGKGYFLVEEFRKKGPFFQKEVIRYIYQEIHQGTIGLSEGNIEEMLRYILTAGGGTMKTLGKLTLRRSGAKLHYVSEPSAL